MVTSAPDDGPFDPDADPAAPPREDLETQFTAARRSHAVLGWVLWLIVRFELFRPDFPSFSAYRRARLGISGGHARNLIVHYEMTKIIAEAGLPAPDSEGQTRPLAVLRRDPEGLVWVWAAACEAGPPKARDVQEWVDLYLGRPDREPTREQEVQKLDGELRRLDNTIRQIDLTDDELDRLRTSIASLTTGPSESN